ncbi:hypothetical protein CWI36_0887p0010 [Hamiltosporidium magnivora]|uniref:Uncharacterized protein n=1 Tax=Hamiltosporidium magnivora TaxID=148818 RepID=A0A4Q9L8V5_9MICR|nr:hypothetical protein CWI36_0887p0010 [Hamiltosporidium magnivora]
MNTEERSEMLLLNEKLNKAIEEKSLLDTKIESIEKRISLVELHKNAILDCICICDGKDVMKETFSDTSSDLFSLEKDLKEETTKKENKPIISKNLKDFVEIEKSENFMEYPAIFTDKNGTFSVFNLGKFPKNNNKQFYSSKYIYPIGYKSFRIFESFLSKNFRSQIYECTILSINNCLDMEIKVDDQYKFSGSSIWSNFCQKFEYPLPFCNVEEFFGLECEELMKKIESLGDQIKDDNQGSKNEGDRAHGFEQENNSNRQNTDFDQNQRKLSEEEKELYFTLNVIAPTSF